MKLFERFNDKRKVVENKKGKELLTVNELMEKMGYVISTMYYGKSINNNDIHGLEAFVSEYFKRAKNEKGQLIKDVIRGSNEIDQQVSNFRSSLIKIKEGVQQGLSITEIINQFKLKIEGKNEKDKNPAEVVKNKPFVNRGLTLVMTTVLTVTQFTWMDLAMGVNTENIDDNTQPTTQQINQEDQPEQQIISQNLISVNTVKPKQIFEIHSVSDARHVKRLITLKGRITTDKFSKVMLKYNGKFITLNPENGSFDTIQNHAILNKIINGSSQIQTNQNSNRNQTQNIRQRQQITPNRNTNQDRNNTLNNNENERVRYNNSVFGVPLPNGIFYVSSTQVFEDYRSMDTSIPSVKTNKTNGVKSVRYVMNKKGYNIHITIPNSVRPGHHKRILLELAKIYSTLPPHMIHGITKGYQFDPGSNPDDPYWANKFNIPDFKSAASAGSNRVVTFYNGSKYFVRNKVSAKRTVAHEICHMVDRASSGYYSSEWSKAIKLDGNSVTWYGDKSVHEDMAELCEEISDLKYLNPDPNALAELQKKHPNRFRVFNKYDQILIENYKKKMAQKISYQSSQGNVGLSKNGLRVRNSV